MYKQLFKIFYEHLLYMTKKYKLVRATGADNNIITSEQSGGRGYTITMPMSPFSTQFSTVIPALPGIPQSVLPSFGPTPPLGRVTTPINLFPPNKNGRVYNLLAEMAKLARETGSMMSDGLPDGLSDTDNIGRSKEWFMGRVDGRDVLVNNQPFNTKKYYTGAGVIVIEIEPTAKTKSVILFADKNDGSFQDAGGKIEQKDFIGAGTLLAVAKRELNEESRNLFNVTTDLQNYVEPPRSFYRCYVVAINSNFDVADYNNNRDLINRSDLHSGWKETSDVAKFSIDQIRGCLATTTNNNKIGRAHV